MQAQILADARKLLDEYGADSLMSHLAKKQGEAAVKRLEGDPAYQLVNDSSQLLLQNVLRQRAAFFLPARTAPESRLFAVP